MTAKERILRYWDQREYFSKDPKDFQTIHYMNRLNTVLGAVKAAIPPPGGILDVGCAQGTAPILLAEHGYRVIGLDADPECIDFAKRRYEFGDCTFLCLDANKKGALASVAPEMEFDAVILGEVLEHLPRPGTLVASCAERLRPGGIMVITTPNGSAPHNWAFIGYDPHAMESGEREHMESGLGARETHLFNFRMGPLLDVVRGCGLVIKRRQFLNSYVVNPLGLHRLLPLGFSARLNRLLPKGPLFSRFFTMTLFVVAQKPA